MSDFDFITDHTVRSNIVRANELILELLFLSESTGYENRANLVNSIRKTIVIYVASIVEAVLLWKLRQSFKTNVAEIEDEWEYKNPHKIHDLQDTGEEIMWCVRKRVKKQVGRLDFNNIIRLCKKHNIISGDVLLQDLHELREMRNTLHIGNVTEIDRDYKPHDLEFCFSVMKRIRKIVRVPQAQ